MRGHSIHGEKAIPGESDQELDYVQVDSVTVDNFLPDVSSDLVKIDVEGSEPLVIDGMLNQISEEEPIILFEYTPEPVGSTPKSSSKHVRESWVLLFQSK